MTLAVIGMVLAAVPLVAGGPRPGAEVRAAAIELASALRQTRSEAIAGFRAEVFYLDTERRVYRVGSTGNETPLPEDLAVSLFTARSELADENAGRIRFFPDGSATGGRVTLAGGGHSYVVAVDWRTGAVEMEQ